MKPERGQDGGGVPGAVQWGSTGACSIRAGKGRVWQLGLLLAELGIKGYSEAALLDAVRAGFCGCVGGQDQDGEI